MNFIVFALMVVVGGTRAYNVTSPADVLANFTRNHFIRCSHLPLESADKSQLIETVLYTTVGGVCDGNPRCQSTNLTCIRELLKPLATVADGSQSTENRLKQLEGFLRNISLNYKPNHSTNPPKHCLSAQELLNELGGNESVANVQQKLATHLLSGDCVLASHSPHPSTGYVWTSGVWPSLSHSAFVQLVNDVNYISQQCQCKKRGRCKRHVEVTPTKDCLNGNILFDMSDADGSGLLNRDEILKSVCPPLMEQLVISATMGPSIGTSGNATEATVDLPNLQAYAYGTIAVAIISLSSVFGVVIIPCLKTRIYNYVMTALIGMGFGILTGDAILHLIPQALGLHAIVHEESASVLHETEEMIPPYLAKCIVILAAIYGLFLFESLSTVVMPGHSHDHGNQESTSGHGHDSQLPVSSIDTKKGFPQEILEIGDHGLQTSSNSSIYGESSTSGEVIEVELAAEAPVICCHLKSLALVITLGDTVHNFADGLVVGAAFASGTKGGISSALAIFCHEIPHELGDFAILLSTGLSRKMVIIINLLSSLSSFAGLYIGVAIGSDQSAVQWTLAMTAGLFLFVALGDMMPELKQQTAGSQWKRILTQNVAVLSGMMFTILMSIYEDAIRL